MLYPEPLTAIAIKREGDLQGLGLREPKRLGDMQQQPQPPKKGFRVTVQV